MWCLNYVPKRDFSVDDGLWLFYRRLQTEKPLALGDSGVEVDGQLKR